MTNAKKTTKPSAHELSTSAAQDAPPKMRVSQSALAASATAEIDALAEKLGVPRAMSPRERRSLMAGLCVPDPFTEAVAALATRHPEVAVGFDADAAREAIAFAAAYAPLARAAHELGARIESQIAVRRATAGASALATYATWKGLARTPGGASLRDSLKTLSVLLKRSHKRRPTAADTVPDAPAEAPVAAH